MSKAGMHSWSNYRLYGPQKGYDDPERSLHVLARGVDDCFRGAEFKKLELSGEIKGDSLHLHDKVSDSSLSASVEYENGERFVSGAVFRVTGKEVLVIKVKFQFWHYEGGKVAVELLRTLRGPITKEEPVKGEGDLTTYEASKFLEVKESKVGSLRNDPYGPPWYKDGTRAYFPREQLARWKEENEEWLVKWREKYQPKKKN